MPGVTSYVLKGGPCDGKTGRLSPPIVSAGQLVCKNGIYKITSPVQVVGGREVFKYAGKVSSGGDGGGAAHAHGGWKDVRHSVNHTMPRSLNRAHSHLEAALRSLSHSRKVRG